MPHARQSKGKHFIQEASLQEVKVWSCATHNCSCTFGKLHKHAEEPAHMKLGTTTKTRRGSWKFCQALPTWPVTCQCLANGWPLKPSLMR
jgi:hypothetical protein